MRRTQHTIEPKLRPSIQALRCWTRPWSSNKSFTRRIEGCSHVLYDHDGTALVRCHCFYLILILLWFRQVLLLRCCIWLLAAKLMDGVQIQSEEDLIKCRNLCTFASLTIRGNSFCQPESSVNSAWLANTRWMSSLGLSRGCQFLDVRYLHGPWST